ncbi:hypothetical protein AB1Y20_020537 [Prymnesium parvum]|uniref:AAA+ ATPase domain-containing protein n=1 Tax=Prymnesium parvum TaxID=97485 RepID=A0AB34JXG8_PRYPA
MCDQLCAAAQRWLAHAAKASTEAPPTGGAVVLAGNASAHELVLQCHLRSLRLEYLEDTQAWRRLSCVHGCPSLVDEVAHALDERDGRWGVLFVEGAQHAPAKQLNQLVSRFWQQSRCVYATARKRVDVDCRRVLFALSTSWGAEQVAHPDARSWSVGRLQSAALVEAAPFLSGEEMSLRARQRLRGAVAVVLGEEGPDFFSSLMAQQDEERRLRREAREEQKTSASLPSLSVFDRVVGQQAVVQEVRQRLNGIANGADGGEDAHTFFFYGFPGTGKTYVAELLALAQHGRRSPPYYQRFSMQNYKTDEDLWKLVSPPCGVKGEGAFAALFANGSGCGNGGCGGRGPVVLFDEIEEARSDFMTSALVNAIDHRGFVEFYRKHSDGTCASEQAPTAGAFIVLTSNCFMDDLDEVWTGARQSNRSVAKVYEATRREMDRRIFDDGIPCSHDGRASPFAARKMKDRMRGNVYPFLPLSEAETVRAFELQLQQRADLYWETSSVEMYWTSHYVNFYARHSPHGVAEAHSATFIPRTIAASRSKHRISLRKQMESMMRLDVNSVERLYARGNEQCSARGERMRSLVLHVRGGEASGTSFCSSSQLVSDPVIDTLADTPDLNTAIEANWKPRWFAQVASAEQCAAGSRLAFGEIPSFTSWIPRGDISSVPMASGFMVLGGNASAHQDALMCVLGHLEGSILWSKLSCATGCPSLVDEVAHALDERDGRWGVLFVEGAQHAPAKQLNQLVSRFWQQSRCVYATARKRVDVDCRRVLFALSTSWGAEQVAHPDARSWSVGRLQSAALVEAAPFLSGEEMSLRARQRLRGAVAVVLGEEGPDFFSSLMAQQDEERRLRREAREEQKTSASLPSLSVFDRVVGQQAVVQEVRQRLNGIANGADGGEDAHTFFFYGFPGTGKTYVAELLALAQHGRRSPPYYQRFSMQNYKTDEDLWKLVSPPCGVKGEGAFAALFANGSGCGNGGCGGRGPVVLFDEIEEARSDFMTSALVNAIDHRGFVEFYRKHSDGTCASEQAPTAGAFIVLTSNCFMDDLDEVWTGARQSNRSVAEVYEATRREMDRRIFDDGIPCSHDGRASPFAARKMKDRMRGNVYPFLPLSEAETVRAFELQLQQRADLYWETSSVEMYWTSEFSRLVVHKDTPAMQVDVSAVGLYRRADFSQGSLSSQPRPRISLRKQMESMMRLDVNSVERLYARGNEQCSARGERMRSLVLHVRGGEASAISFCDGAMLSGTSVSNERSEKRSVVAHPTVNGGSLLHTDDRGSARAAREKSASSEKEIIVTTDMQHAKETGLLKEQNMQLAAKIELLEGRIIELQADLLRWKLLCLVLATWVALTFAGLTYLLVGYTAALVKSLNIVQQLPRQKP